MEYLPLVPFADFRDRALGEGLRYKEDRMVFLRELAQNSRDAGARRVGISAQLEGDDVVIAFGDDGSGMSFDHARRFLFTLYASSKEDEERAAGRFGVGFWSVLLLDPDRVIVESMTEGGEGWAVALDGALREPRRVECGLRTPGTRITLRKRVSAGGEGQRVLLEVERALSKYCRYLRQNDRAASALPVSLNGKRVDRPFSVGGPCWLAFRDGAVEGAVGLGERPRVELYARGILVWRGTSIEELRHGAAPAPEPSFPDGLAPVYILCGNDLSVTMDRRAVIDDRALRRVRLASRRRMRELLGMYLDGVSPRSLPRRAGSWIAGRLADLRAEPRPGPWVALASVLGAMAIAAFLVGPRLVAGQPILPAGPGAPPASAPAGAFPPAAAPALPAALGPPPRFDGPLVHPAGGEARTFLRYTPPGEPVLLRLAVAEELHPGRGPRSAAPGPLRPAPRFRCAAGCVSVETVVDAGPGVIHLPTPTGHRVETGSIFLAGRPVAGLRLTPEGLAAVELPGAVRGGLLYRTGPSGEPLEPARRDALLAVTGADALPADLAAAVSAALTLPTAEGRMGLLRSFVEQRIAYDRGPETAAAFARGAAGDPADGWAELVAGIGRGDCDVKNGLLVLLARRAGVPARLVIGFAGRDGEVEPGLHAWAEYHDQGWVPADATGASVEPVAPPGAAPAQRAVPLPSPAAEPFADAVKAPRPAWLVPLIAVAAGTALIAALAGLALLLAGRVSRKLVAPGGGEVRRKVAAEMIAGALSRPGAWSGTVLARPLIPVLGGRRPMSLAEALALGRAGRLWFGAGKDSLARRAVAAGARILDAADPVFGDIGSRIPGAANLDEISRLAPVDADSLAETHRAAGELVEEADGLLTGAGMRPGVLLPCPGLGGAVSRDVVLAGLPVDGTAFPRRFVAVAVSHPEVRRCAALAATDRPLAAFLLLDSVLSRSGLLGRDRDELRRRAAALALEVPR